jgi:hypothetical protein
VAVLSHDQSLWNRIARLLQLTEHPLCRGFAAAPPFGFVLLLSFQIQ